MKIVHLLAGNQAILGGLEKHVVDLSKAQSSQGHRVYVFVCEKLIPFFADTVTILPVRFDRARLDPRLGWELERKLKEIQPDIVHAHANKAASAFAKLIRKLRFPAVATVQNIKRDQSIFRPFDRVIAVSEVVAESLLPTPSTVILNSVSPPEADSEATVEKLCPPYRGEGTPILYAAGRFVPAKGYDLLIDAIKRIPDANLWLVGDGPDRKQLEIQIERENLTHRVWMPGFLPVQQVLGLMRIADLFIVSSRREGGPYTLSEALRHRCPVVSTRVGFAPQLLEETQLTQSISASSIGQKIEYALQDLPAYRESMDPVFQRANTELDLDYMVNRVMEVYESLLANNITLEAAESSLQ